MSSFGCVGVALACRCALALVIAAAALSAPVHAQSSRPQPRVVSEGHVGAVKQLVVVPAAGTTLSIGEDKTLRLWRTRDLHLIRTIPLPSETTREGVPYALASTPDGRVAYVGGYTGVTWHGGATVYAVELATGRLSPFIKNQSGEVHALAMSRDGKRLAIGLSDRVKVMDIETKSVVMEDTQYSERLDTIDFGPAGELATTSSDGCLRIYRGADLKLAFRQQYPPAPGDAQSACNGSALGDVQFSPDGTLLAFGVQNRPEIVLMDVRRLAPLRVIVPPEAGQFALCCVSWSTDGDSLLMFGPRNQGVEETAIYHVARRGLSAPRMMAVVNEALTQAAAADGDWVLSSNASTLRRMDAYGQTKASTPRTTIDFSEASQALFLSPNGHVAAFRPSPDSTAHLVFSLDTSPDNTLTQADSAPRGLTNCPDTGRLSVKTGPLRRHADRSEVTIDGKPATLAAFETPWTWCSHATRPLVVLGTNWFVRLMGPNAKQRWAQYVSSPVQAVNLTDDGQWVVAALGDGTLRWYNVATGAEQLGLFVHRNMSEWVAWRSDGYYTSSPNGDQYIGWLVNRGDTHAPDFFRAVQFERNLYRPDLVRGALAVAKTGDSSERLATTLRQLAAPRVTIETIEPAREAGTVSIRFSAEATGRAIREVGVFVDGIPVLAAAERTVGSADSMRLVRTVTARMALSGAAVRVEAESDGAIGLDESGVLTAPKVSVAGRPGRLWLVAVGVQQFDRVPYLLPLPFATNDARELADAFAAQQGKAFSDVRTFVLTESSDSKPTKANILAQLRELDQMRPEDTLVVFLASHGTADAAEYYFVAKDADPADVRKLIEAQKNRTRIAPGSAPSLLSGTELTVALHRLPGRRILILDTCQAGAAGNSDPYSLVKRSASAQLAVVSAARGNESSYESPTRPHGAFTIAIIDALTGRLKTPDGPITLRNAFDAAAPQVRDVIRQIRSRARSVAEQTKIQQTPVLSATVVLQNSVLASH